MTRKSKLFQTLPLRPLKLTLDIFRRAFSAVSNRKVQLFKALLGPFCVILSTYTLPDSFLPGYGFIILALAAAGSYIYAAIIIHRIVLMGPNSVPTWGFYMWGWRETLFWLFGIGIAAISMIPTLVSTLLIQDSDLPYVDPLAQLVSIYIFARLALVFPSIAVDREITFSDSWKLTRSHSIPMLIIIGAFPYLLFLPVNSLETFPTLLGGLIAALYTCLAEVLIIAVLSKAFQSCTENRSA